MAPAKRPTSVVLGVVLMVPVFLAWLAAGPAWMVVTSNMEGDGMILFWILGVAILALCLLLAFMAGAGMLQAWRGQSMKISIPAGFTLFLFFISVLNMIINGKIDFAPSQLVPLVLGACAGAALFLLNGASASAWFARSGRR
ncbi:hypothetical protein [Streptosporangium lutulentum]|uniref:Uncharacterized protein n=1 Tax=Streptosporangium lutulentum TaxID=1461250 RepID=A0ABT9QQN5_9ACTN|nr:hypothetical protein [Streptosporangium lutulentum]MDP9849043.1 hypothetical protein [Streptosporangium lutulentum]